MSREQDDRQGWERPRERRAEIGNLRDRQGVTERRQSTCSGGRTRRPGREKPQRRKGWKEAENKKNQNRSERSEGSEEESGL